MHKAQSILVSSAAVRLKDWIVEKVHTPKEWKAPESKNHTNVEKGHK